MPTVTRQNAAVFQRPLVRPEPVLPVHQMKTYSVARPLRWWVFMDCETYGCRAYYNGWRTVLPANSDLLDVARRSGRKFTEIHGDGLIEFRFEPGQQCFHTPRRDAVGRSVFQVIAALARDGKESLADKWHKGTTDRPPLFAIQDGDWRGNPWRTRPRLLRPDQWVDSMQADFDRVRTRKERG